RVPREYGAGIAKDKEIARRRPPRSDPTAGRYTARMPPPVFAKIEGASTPAHPADILASAAGFPVALGDQEQNDGPEQGEIHAPRLRDARCRRQEDGRPLRHV